MLSFLVKNSIKVENKTCYLFIDRQVVKSLKLLCKKPAFVVGKVRPIHYQ